MRVLLADDDSDFLGQQSRLLETSGYKTVECLSESEARDEIRRNSEDIDIALLDMWMDDEESGLRLVRLLSDEFPSIVSIVLTGVGEVRNAGRCMEAGCFGYVLKDFSADLLHATLERAGVRRLGLLRRDLERRRTALENSILSFYQQATWELFEQASSPANVPTTRMRNVSDALYELYAQFRDRGSALLLPDDGTPTRELADVLVSIPNEWRPSSPVPEGRMIRADADAVFPPPDLVLRYLLGLNLILPAGVVIKNSPVECDVSGAFGLVRIGFQGLTLGAAELDRMNEVLRGAEVRTINEAGLAGFAFGATAIGGVVTTVVGGGNTEVVTRIRLS